MIGDSFLLSLKNLKHRGVRSWLTLLGIFIGVMAVVSLISLGNALQVAVSSQFGISQTELITVEATGGGFGPPGEGAVTPLIPEDADEIGKLSSVKRVFVRNVGNGKLEYKNKVLFGGAISIPLGENRDFVYDQIYGDPVAGRLLKDSDFKKVFLGYNFYVDKVGLGEEVLPGKTVLINDEEFEVVGILEKKGSFIFDNVVYMNQDEMEDLFNHTDKVDEILVLPTDRDDVSRTKEDIEKLMRERRDVDFGKEDFSVLTPEASLEAVNGILGGVQAFIVIVAGISIFIGSLGIVNTMTTSVLERKKEIGIMKSIGARNDHIFLQFFIESSLLGFLGGVVGVILGVLIGWFGTVGINNWIGAEIKPMIDFGLIFFALLGSFIIGGIAGIVPAMNAAKQNPVEAIRT